MNSLSLEVGLRQYSLDRIKNLFVLLYVLMIFEGVLRKWVAPSLGSLLFFVKDPFVLLVYFYALRARFFYMCVAMYVFLGVAALLIMHALFFIFYDPEKTIVYLYGLRNYLFYIPLIFVGAKCLEWQDLVRIARVTVYIVMPVSVLVFLQYISPPTSLINKGTSVEGFVFQIAEGVVRPYGTFTFTLGHVLFVASVFVFWLSAFFRDYELFEKHKYRVALISFALAGTIFMFFTTGSRSIYAHAALVLIVLGVANFFVPNVRVVKAYIVLIFILVFIGGVFSFTDTYQLLIERNLSAIDSEGSPLLRALSSLYVFWDYIYDTPFWGYGIGTGTNAAAALLRGSREQGMGFLLAEDEWSRIVLELGYLVGIVYIMFRAFLVAWLFKLSLVAYRRGFLMPVLMFGFIGPVVLNGVLTMQGTVLAYGALFSSFIAAGGRIAKGEMSENS